MPFALGFLWEVCLAQLLLAKSCREENGKLSLWGAWQLPADLASEFVPHSYSFLAMPSNSLVF